MIPFNGKEEGLIRSLYHHEFQHIDNFASHCNQRPCAWSSAAWAPQYNKEVSIFMSTQRCKGRKDISLHTYGVGPSKREGKPGQHRELSISYLENIFLGHRWSTSRTICTWNEVWHVTSWRCRRPCGWESRDRFLLSSQASQMSYCSTGFFLTLGDPGGPSWIKTIILTMLPLLPCSGPRRSKQWLFRPSQLLLREPWWEPLLLLKIWRDAFCAGNDLDTSQIGGIFYVKIWK